MDEQSLRTAFDKLTGCFERGDVAGFMAGLDPGLTMFDEDIPFRLDKAGFQQHVGLLAGNMESMAFIPHDTRLAVHGQTGVVDGYFDFRGKPTAATASVMAASLWPWRGRTPRGPSWPSTSPLSPAR